MTSSYLNYLQRVMMVSSPRREVYTTLSHIINSSIEYSHIYNYILYILASKCQHLSYLGLGDGSAIFVKRSKLKIVSHEVFLS